jgi:hypothetical protein
MPVTPPFSPFVTTSADGLPENLKPHPPADIPEAPGAGNPHAGMSPFSEPQDVDHIISSLSLNRPLPLHIPNREDYKEYDFLIINDTPQEHAAAQRAGWAVVDHPVLTALFEGKVSGTDKTGKITRPVLVSRHKRITEILAKRQRQQLSDMYQAMDPRNRQFNSKYADTEAVINAGTTKGQFTGAGWRIKV